MGYVFRGFFLKQQAPAVAAVVQWPFCNWYRITDQMDGYAVTSTDGDDAQMQELSKGLPAFSVDYPEVLFVYLQVKCFGGVCDNGGFHAQNGQIVRAFPARSAGGAERTDSPLRAILAPMDVHWLPGNGNYFKPLTRGYFR